MSTILVVDDEPIVLKLCQRILQMGGYEVLVASNGQDALGVLPKSEIALALIDVMMPGMNGIELAKRIQSDYPSTKVVLMTGFGPSEIAKVTGPNNPHRIIWKPFRTESLLRMIENVLGDALSTSA